jgi:hypothetical protein
VARHPRVGVASAGALRLVEGEQRELGFVSIEGRRRAPLASGAALLLHTRDAARAQPDGSGCATAGSQQLTAVEVVRGSRQSSSVW